MSQQDVLNFLKSNKGRWFSCREISIAVGVNLQTSSANLVRLKKNKLVMFKELKNGRMLYRWKH